MAPRSEGLQELGQLSEAIRHALVAVVSGETLSRAEAEAVMGAVLDGEVTPAQLGALLMGLRMRGETVEELTGFASAMRARVIRVHAPAGVIDTCGTGGDLRATFNISTASALVVAAAGVPVAKHGNRAVTSASGSSDVIGALGLSVETSAEEAEASIAEVGFGFLHAPGFHPGMRHAGPTRRELGVRTAFNLCGPIANPAMPARQLVGVADPASAERVAHALRALGVERAFVVHGDRIDELPLDGSGVIYDVRPDGVTRLTVDPSTVGIERADSSALAGGSPDDNAAIIRAIFDGSHRGPAADVVALNAGAALVVAGRAEILAEGVALARETIASGRTAALLERLRARETARVEAAQAADAAAAAGANPGTSAATVA
jgi:anthranilate phosphoribosyltransferase